MIDRHLRDKLKGLLDNNSAVVLIGARQAGKTTLALDISAMGNAVYLDLESPRDLAKLTDIEMFCSANSDKLIILDEIQRIPDLFAPLRSIIDNNRRKGRKYGQFLLLGSASIDLLKQSSESLAGRIALIELSPFNALELDPEQAALHKLWVRGGFPESYLSKNDTASTQWRWNFIRTYLERDIPRLGPRIPSETLHRLWTMLAHNQGGILNSSRLSSGLGISGQTVSRYIDLLVDLLLVRRLRPWTRNVGKRLVKSPKVYVRDSGVVHALLCIEEFNSLLGHPVAGGSWEGFVIENILAPLSDMIPCSYYRTSAGAEIDLVLEPAANERWAIEIKLSIAPRVSRVFYTACEDVAATRKILIYPGEESYPIAGGVEAMGLRTFMQELKTV